MREIERTNVKVCNGLRAIRDWLDDWLARFHLLFVVDFFLYLCERMPLAAAVRAPLIFERFHFNGTHTHMPILSYCSSVRRRAHIFTEDTMAVRNDAVSRVRVRTHSHALAVSIFNFLFSYFLGSSLSCLYRCVRRSHR